MLGLVGGGGGGATEEGMGCHDWGRSVADTNSGLNDSVQSTLFLILKLPHILTGQCLEL